MSDERLDPAEAELQEWIDDILQSPAATPTASDKLRAEIKHSIRRSQRRSFATKTLVAAAAAILVLLSLPTQEPPVSVDHPVDHPPIPIASAPTRPYTTPLEQTTESTKAPVATFVGRSDLITVPIECDDPTVTVIQIYPTTITHRRRQRAAALHAAIQALPNNTTQITPAPFQGG